MKPPQQPVDLTRRHIIKQFSLCTAASIISGKLWTARVLADVSSGPNVGVIRIRIADYPALDMDYGSVQFKFNSFVGTYYPFTVTRAPGNVFHAVDTRCPHEGLVVGPLEGGMGGVMNCINGHGSTYDIQGQVLSGPATSNLTSYATSFNSTTGIVCVEVPAIYTKISTVSVQSSTASTIRLRLQFPTLNSGCIYKVQYQQTLTDAPVFVNFATTAGGAASASQIVGNSGTRSVWVDATGTTGFFTVALVVTPYSP
jgi:nitrite reductase/ring-hydroxylating ferredoxin subunit